MAQPSKSGDLLHSVWVEVPDVSEGKKNFDGENRTYAPLIDTLRLYAGWLLVWYFIVYALGAVQLTRHLPVHSLIVSSLFSSQVIANCAFGVFLFLLFSALHRVTGGGALRAILLFLAGAVFLFLFISNT